MIARRRKKRNKTVRNDEGEIKNGDMTTMNAIRMAKIEIRKIYYFISRTLLESFCPDMKNRENKNENHQFYINKSSNSK